MAINKCSSDNWRSKIYKFVQSGIKAANFIVKKNQFCVYIRFDVPLMFFDIIAQLTNEELKKKSALVKHVCLNGHRIYWESSEILAIESDYKKRRFLESFYIHKTDFF